MTLEWGDWCHEGRQTSVEALGDAPAEAVLVNELHLEHPRHVRVHLHVSATARVSLLSSILSSARPPPFPQPFLRLFHSVFPSPLSLL